MIHLRLFGTVGLFDDSGTGREQLLSQQKRTALLAYLAVARPRGAHSREALTGMFWPELTDKRARSALNQALYYLRNAIGNEALSSRAGEHVRLMEGEVDCDVTSFEAHLDRGELKQAIALYRGPFMDGFFLSGLDQFEAWVESERVRLAERATRAVWQLADSAAARGDADEAIEYARRGMELSHDEGSVRRLIQIRDTFGDRIGAIREYDRFARQVARELEAEPSPETQLLVKQIRARTASSATPSVPQRAITLAKPAAELLPSAPVVVATQNPIDSQMTHAVRSRRWRIAAALIPAIALSFWLFDFASGRKPTMSGPPSVAVLPFSFTGDPARATASNAVVGLLDAQISAGRQMRTVDWRQVAAELSPDSRPISPAHAAEIARRYDADLFIVGSVNEAVGRYRITGSLYSTFDASTPQVTAIVQCDANSLFEAIDTLVTKLRVPTQAQRARPVETITRLDKSTD